MVTKYRAWVVKQIGFSPIELSERETLEEAIKDVSHLSETHYVGVEESEDGVDWSEYYDEEGCDVEELLNKNREEEYD